MRKISKTSIDRTSGRLQWASRVMPLGPVLGAILVLAGLQHPTTALSATPPGSYSVALAWDASASPDATGYRVYYGATSGNYTNSLAVGNVTTNTISGLASGVTYFVAITAYNAGGLESPFSSEISYTASGGVPTIQVHLAANGQAILTVAGVVGHTYEIQAAPSLSAWTILSTVTLGASGATTFTDTAAAGVPQRFYRTRDTQP